MKCFVVLSAVVACGFAAPVADADAQLLAGHGLVGGVYAAGHAVAAPAVAAYAAPAVATVAHATPAVATYAHAAPAVAAYAAPAVATVPVVHQVGYNVHHQVHHVPQVSVQKHVSTHTTSHVINHAPVVGAALAHHGVVAAPAVAGVAGVVAV